MKAEKTNSTIEVGGMDTFRRMTTIMTLISSVVSAIIIVVRPRECDSNPHLRNAVIITLSAQLSIFFLLLLGYIGCGCCLKKAGGYLGIFYFLITGLMTWV